MNPHLFYGYGAFLFALRFIGIDAQVVRINQIISTYVERFPSC